MEMMQGVWKQHLRPHAAVGYGVKIFLPSPPNYVTRSPGGNEAHGNGRIPMQSSLAEIEHRKYLLPYTWFKAIICFRMNSTYEVTIQDKIFRHSAQGSAHQKSQNFSGIFRVLQFHLYVLNTKVLNH